MTALPLTVNANSPSATVLADPPRPSSPAQQSALDGLAARLAARVSSSNDEIAPFASRRAALDALAAALFAGRRAVVARPAGDAIAACLGGAARVVREVSAQPFDALVAAARDAEVLVVSCPVLADGVARATLSPRELLLLRSRAPRPVIVLDLLEEDRARTPLTQPALLLPGTVILRGFGTLWRDAGAPTAAELAFIAGPRDLVDLVAGAAAGPRMSDTTAVDACEELDRPRIDRDVQELACRLRGQA